MFAVRSATAGLGMAASQTVLIVDDEPDFRLSMRQLLGFHGYQTAEAANGIEALRVMEQEPVSLLITDLFMPRMDGIELLRNVRRNATHLPGIIAVTGDLHL